MDGRMDRQMENLYSTGLRPLPGPLPCSNLENLNPTIWKIIVEQGKGTADHLVPLGSVLVVSLQKWLPCKIVLT